MWTREACIDFARLALQQLHFAAPMASLSDNLQDYVVRHGGGEGSGLLSVASSSWVENYTITGFIATSRGAEPCKRRSTPISAGSSGTN
ncbi:uncharacterized protein BT62DRAFT_97541 [Guyanagaster necrorhizus]|uniref:Uncharacterized protein n=1 Tax=Guyanagaster necrorhizus TaxID=856835 RepID=A0A9P8AT31_9AGAR|nr:uncharacterized protein BT62DRAFT_97541 [Guyanagaster necrorhizus MCA 3950]KAG7447018.1 hypothetical protein BT62DRAFT_97541 [Guyanagaster necrorhizus MCA 3950]